MTDIDGGEVETPNNKEQRGDDTDEQCPKCNRTGVTLVDVRKTDDFEYDEVCGYCIHNLSKRVGTEEKKPPAQERKERRQAQPHVQNGSGWPR